MLIISSSAKNIRTGAPAVRTYHMASPWGTWQAAFTSAGLRELRLPGRSKDRGRLAHAPLLDDQEGKLGQTVLSALHKRLQGLRKDLPWEAFDLGAQPPFFLRAWRALHAIPYGETCTYAELAHAAGSPKALRAAGQACGANPIVFFIPCHRVVAASGLGGFGAGLEWKRRLLALERIPIPASA